MKRLLLAFLALSWTATAAEKLVLCGWDEIFMIDPAAGTPAKIWSWKAKDHPEIPATLVKSFGTTDECKPLDGGKRLLVSSSGGGCALLELPGGKAVWSAKVANAHSIEWLPGDRILVASSVGGNKLVLFDLKHGDKVLWDTPLVSAHGLVWDEKRQRLFALGLTELRTYSLKDWDTETPSLVMEKTTPLPDDNGHDLRPVPGSADLVLTTAKHVWLFNRDESVIRPHPEWKDRIQVKCIDIHPGNGRVFMNQADGRNWWNESFELLNPDQKIRMEGEKLYKGRWLAEP
ncbi:hypothetical protein KBB96_15695 [Luteolibacter ambystomatis]|uniref:WD40 repeat domain-containing protein n=1 Tax=Luteolibacter ambystomatis TaxID=2824561 RepID=A0A975G8L2_9BACT|nr:DUF6528 family protein [Luteolibacter ambystomatis]QUE50305.1 hypothetical protein KBB96_15695 [Luteolibacter ambystomatis]